MANQLRAWGPAAVWAAVLFFLSAQPDIGLSGLDLNDKLAHFGLYAVLGAALALGRSRAPREVPHAVLIAIGVLYGASDEWHQAFVPGRTPAWGDWLADTAGVVIGYLSGLRFLGARGRARPGTGTDRTINGRTT